MLTVDIDTGGTMTDALVSNGVLRHSFKVDTTPHDYTVSFTHCLSEAAKALNFPDVEAFLREVGIIRWSSTITTNVLAERRGAKVGLLVDKGHEKDLYGQGMSRVVGEIVDDSNIIGLSHTPSPAEVLAAVKELLEGGVRRICICLKDSFPDNSRERQIKEIIEDQYPDHIIGAVPVLLGSEMIALRHDQTRVHYSLMNAYTHNQLANSLFKAEDILRDDYRWNGPLLVGHTNGGVARIGKTKAVDTIESGPVFGVFGGAHMAQAYHLTNAVCFDVGGTTTKCSIVKNQAPVFQRGGELMETPVQSSFAMLRSAAVGGGSIAHVQDGLVSLGPKSMGAAPGPACYGLGGTSPTLTDALLVLGYLDPNNFLGGKRILQTRLAYEVIERDIAKPLGISVEVAALSIRDQAVEIMKDLVQSTLAEAQLDATQATLFSFGGNGPMFATFLADKLHMKDAYAFDLGPVFSTFGSAVSDVVHVYEQGVDGGFEAGRVALALNELRNQAMRDLRGEGFNVADAASTWEIDVGNSDDQATTVSVSLPLDTENDPTTALHAEINAKGLSAQPMLLLRLTTRLALDSHEIAPLTSGTTGQPSGKRVVHFDASGGKDTPVIQWESLTTGASLQGPAIINGATLTCPLPPGWSLSVDDYGNAKLSHLA